MLEETQEAERRLNDGRSKPLRFDVKHHLVEKDAAHAEYLRRVLQARGHLRDGERVALYREEFGDVVDKIISDIERRQPRSGRSIFLLDQFGYTDADIRFVDRIGKRLQNAEVILTVSVDALLNFSTRDNIVGRLDAIGFPKGLVEEALRTSSDTHIKAVMQRALPQLFAESTLFHWFTPFFIRPARSRWALWFAHFSREAKARDVMLDCHWEVRNSFAHYGESLGPKMLGFEALQNRQVPLLTFDEGDRKEMNAALAAQLAPLLYAKSKAQLPFMDVVKHFGNSTAATIGDFNEVVLAARNAGEIQIVGADGRPRSRTLGIVKPGDMIELPSQLILPLGARDRQDAIATGLMGVRRHSKR